MYLVRRKRSSVLIENRSKSIGRIRKDDKKTLPHRYVDIFGNLIDSQSKKTTTDVK